MTRKKFYKMRLALAVNMNRLLKGSDVENKHPGKVFKAMRGVSGKPIVDFDAPCYSHIHSYQEAWDSLMDLRKAVRMD